MATVKFKLVGGKMPTKATPWAAGLDIHALEGGALEPGECKLFSTGVYVEVDPGFEVQVRPRSGLALRGITVMNSPGTIDSDYRGEIKVMLVNHGQSEFCIESGNRIAQLVVARVEPVDVLLVEELTPTQRGQSGFGSTGL